MVLLQRKSGVDATEAIIKMEAMNIDDLVFTLWRTSSTRSVSLSSLSLGPRQGWFLLKWTGHPATGRLANDLRMNARLHSFDFKLVNVHNDVESKPSHEVSCVAIATMDIMSYRTTNNNNNNRGRKRCSCHHIQATP